MVPAENKAKCLSSVNHTIKTVQSNSSDGFFWEKMKALEDQAVIVNSQFFRFYQMCKSLHEPFDNNSNTISTTPTVSLPSNIPVCSNYDTYISLLSEGIDSIEQLFDTQLQNLTQMSPVKSNRRVKR